MLFRSISDHIQAILDHAGKGIIDYCIYDTGEVVPEFVRRYNKQGQDLVDQDIIQAKEKGARLVQRDLSTIVEDNIRHSPKAVAEAIIQIICDDLKYRDMQNDPEYVMLNTRLREEKKAKKRNTARRAKTRADKRPDKKLAVKAGKHERKSSKFSEKYHERIRSIQTSEEKREQKIEFIEKLQMDEDNKNP